mmetsp:Transcript_12388/g.28572  ORF Transcript_12388/g.28572 Transcript_12388/m.28572 type:complete len:216 (+) Transcript_12388:205-852(+)
MLKQSNWVASKAKSTKLRTTLPFLNGPSGAWSLSGAASKTGQPNPKHLLLELGPSLLLNRHRNVRLHARLPSGPSRQPHQSADGQLVLRVQMTGGLRLLLMMVGFPHAWLGLRGTRTTSWISWVGYWATLSRWGMIWVRSSRNKTPRLTASPARLTHKIIGSAMSTRGLPSWARSHRCSFGRRFHWKKHFVLYSTMIGLCNVLVSGTLLNNAVKS